MLDMVPELISCRVCGKVHALPALEAGFIARCARCTTELRQVTPASLHLTAAFTLSALLLYGPANLFPILSMSMYGSVTENTIFTGVVRFYRDGDYFVGTVVFLASILIPFLKILGLLFVVIATKFKFKRAKKFRVWIYKTVETLGRWAMLDVFALAVLISLIKMERIASVVPGKGCLAFVLVIIFTIMASASFDPQLIWKEDSQS